MRASAIIDKALHLDFGGELADRWVKLPNRRPLFAGLSPIDGLQQGAVPAIIAARDSIDAAGGGM